MGGTATSVLAPRFLGDGRIGTWERPVPQPGRGELLIEVRANALCGTDRGAWERGATVVPGHEASGVVNVAGPDTSLRAGTPGVVYLMDYCGQCRSCVAGASNQCLSKRGDVGFDRDGGLGRFVIVHESQFFAIDPSIDFAAATLLLDVMGTSSHALARARLVQPEIRAVAVGGAGPVGLGLVAMTRLLMSDVPVVVADVVPGRLALAERLGARTVDLRNAGLAAGIRASGIDDIDVAIDTAGRTGSRAALLGVLAERGVLVCVGHGESLALEVSEDLIAPERAILGSEYFRWDELPANHELLLEHREYLGQIVTDRLPVTQLEEACRRFFGGSAGKVVVEQ
jgi:threonine dehydrogenase-like Zn-dependent dehydrogenase